MKDSIEVGEVFRVHGGRYKKRHRMPLRHHRAMRAIEICRTAELGGHVDECDACGGTRISYNSCRNRHCPKCQSLDKERWLEKRKADVLSVLYFHVVFTVPEKLRALALRNQRVFYNLLFKTVSDTLKALAKDPKHLGAEIGFIALLHTWTQTLLDHPHIHCIIPGGGLSFDGSKWIPFKEDFFIPVQVLSRLFRGKFLHGLRASYDQGDLVFPGRIEEVEEEKVFEGLLSELYAQQWIVYCKKPMTRAEDVLEYLGRYTHRVAITNDRLHRMEKDRVTFKYRDSEDGGRIKYMTLGAEEFIRRFLLHILPKQFMKIRHYGILSNRNRMSKLVICKDLLHGPDDESNNHEMGKETWQDLLLRLTGTDPRICPHCGKGRMAASKVLPSRVSRYPPDP